MDKREAFDGRKCQVCDGPLRARHVWTCSRRCHNKSVRAPVVSMKCLQCGVAYHKKESLVASVRADGYESKYCGMECQQKARKKPDTWLLLECFQCGDPVYKPRSHHESAKKMGCTKTFCSFECVSKHKFSGGSLHGGYRIVIHPSTKKKILQHRLVWEQAHGPLPSGATVHHRNGDKLDNRLENLELWVSNHGRGQRLLDLAADQCARDPHFYSQLTLAVMQRTEKSA